MALTRVTGSVFDLEESQDLVAGTISDGDGTPTVLAASVLTTANTTSTTITDFDGGVTGQVVLLIINDANTTLDFTGSSLKGNGGVDRLMASGESVLAIADATAANWYCQVFPIAATAALAGVVEVATSAEINTGTDAARAVSPDALAASYSGTKEIVIHAFAAATDVATGDGAAYFHVPASLNGMDIVSVHALNAVAGITGTCDVQIHNVTDTADILSTKLTIDTTEVGSDTAATPAVIDAANDDLATNDVLRIDVDAVHSGTAPKGLIITMECRLP